MRKRGCITAKLVAKLLYNAGGVSITVEFISNFHPFSSQMWPASSPIIMKDCTNHSVGVNHLITMDLHHKEIQAFFDCSVDNLRASPFIIQYILDHVPDYK